MEYLGRRDVLHVGRRLPVWIPRVGKHPGLFPGSSPPPSGLVRTCRFYPSLPHPPAFDAGSPA